MAQFPGPLPPMGPQMHPGAAFPQQQQRHFAPRETVVIVDSKTKYVGCTFTLPESTSGKKPGWNKATQTIWRKSQSEIERLSRKKTIGGVNGHDVTDCSKLTDLPLEAQRRIENWQQENENNDREVGAYKWVVHHIKEKTKSGGLFGTPQVSIDVVLKRKVRPNVRELAESPTSRSPGLNRSGSYHSPTRPQFPQQPMMGAGHMGPGMMGNGGMRPNIVPLQPGPQIRQVSPFDDDDEDTEDDSDLDSAGRFRPGFAPGLQQQPPPPPMHMPGVPGMPQGQFRPGMPGMPGMPGQMPQMPPRMPGAMPPQMQGQMPGQMRPQMPPHMTMPGGMPLRPPMQPGQMPQMQMPPNLQQMPPRMHQPHPQVQLNQQRPSSSHGLHHRSASRGHDRRPDVICASSDDESVLISTDDNMSVRTPMTPRSLGEEIPYHKKSSSSYHRRSSSHGRRRDGDVYREHKRGNNRGHHRNNSSDSDSFVFINKSGTRRRESVHGTRPSNLRYAGATTTTANRRRSSTYAHDDSMLQHLPRQTSHLKDLQRELHHTELSQRSTQIEQLEKQIQEMQLKGRDDKIDQLRSDLRDLERQRRTGEMDLANERRRRQQAERDRIDQVHLHDRELRELRERERDGVYARDARRDSRDRDEFDRLGAGLRRAYTGLAGTAGAGLDRDRRDTHRARRSTMFDDDYNDRSARLHEREYRRHSDLRDDSLDRFGNDRRREFRDRDVSVGVGGLRGRYY